MTPREAASAIHKRFMSTTRPFAGFLVCVGVKNESIVVMTRREPTEKEKQECIGLSEGVPVEFLETGDLAPLGGAT